MLMGRGTESSEVVLMHYTDIFAMLKRARGGGAKSFNFFKERVQTVLFRRLFFHFVAPPSQYIALYDT